VDATFGRGGHSRLNSGAGWGPEAGYRDDRDPEAIAAARDLRTRALRRVHARFSELQATLVALHAGGATGCCSIWACPRRSSRPAARLQLPGRCALGHAHGPDGGESAAEWLERAEEAEIREVLSVYGEERLLTGLQKAIVASRRRGLSADRGTCALVAAPSGRVNREGSGDADVQLYGFTQSGA